MLCSLFQLMQVNIYLQQEMLISILKKATPIVAVAPLSPSFSLWKYTITKNINYYCC